MHHLPDEPPGPGPRPAALQDRRLPAQPRTTGRVLWDVSFDRGTGERNGKMLNVRDIFGLLRKTDRPGTDAPHQTISVWKRLLSEIGESSEGHVASQIISLYRLLEPPARALFFDLLLTEFSPDPIEVGRSGDAYREKPSAENLARLLRVVEPRRQELFRRLNIAAGGTQVLVEMRAQLLEELPAHPVWKPIEADLAHLLTSWFNRGFLVLRRIDWHTSASVLEKLMKYEAVHEIQGWQDLRRRLESDRRCYAFFHPALPDEPIIFIEVALTRGMSDKVQPLLGPATPLLNAEYADCAVFYSITNCQKGLRGMPFGSFLIKQVVEDLSRELPRLKTFATLSPVPGFRKWLNENLKSLQDKNSTLADLPAKLEDPAWFEDQELQRRLQRDLVPLCACYLWNAKQDREPRDSVARFHLRNGARLQRINWLADTSWRGMEHSAGLMVNYVYRLPEVERNHELYTREYKITASREIEFQAKRFPVRGATPEQTPRGDRPAWLQKSGEIA